MFRSLQVVSVKVDDILLRDEKYFKKADIEVCLNSIVEGVDTRSKKVKLESREIGYDKLFIATGCSPRGLPSLTSAIRNVHTIRVLEDAKAFVEQIDEHKNVLLIGSSFIGKEQFGSLQFE